MKVFLCAFHVGSRHSYHQILARFEQVSHTGVGLPVGAGHLLTAPPSRCGNLYWFQPPPPPPPITSKDH